MVKLAGKKKMGHVIVVGNEKGGSGKSTTAMHITNFSALAQCHDCTFKHIGASRVWARFVIDSLL